MMKDRDFSEGNWEENELWRLKNTQKVTAEAGNSSPSWYSVRCDVAEQD